MNKFGQKMPRGGFVTRQQQEEAERRWETNFHLMCSKDNPYLPKYNREFFDNPLLYDVNGTRLYISTPV